MILDQKANLNTNEVDDDVDRFPQVVHGGITKFKCPKTNCMKEFKLMKNLKIHMRIHV
jgi:hypothetical protein